MGGGRDTLRDSDDGLQRRGRDGNTAECDDEHLNLRHSPMFSVRYYP